VAIKSFGYKTGDEASICIDGKEFCPNKPGVNVVVMDLMTYQATEVSSFDTGHDKEASEQLVEFIDMVPVGALVFIAVRGEANYYLTGHYAFFCCHILQNYSCLELHCKNLTQLLKIGKYMTAWPVLLHLCCPPHTTLQPCFLLNQPYFLH